jgi:hypothetical protein
MIRIPGLAYQDHTFTVPLDHADPTAETIEVFAREVVAADKVGDELPWLLFLQCRADPVVPRRVRRPRPVGSAMRSRPTGYYCSTSAAPGAAHR